MTDDTPRKPIKLEMDAVYTDRELTKIFGVGPKFFGRLRKKGGGPEYSTPGGWSVRYWGREVFIWAKMNVRFSTVSHLEPKQKKKKLKIFVGYASSSDAGVLAAMRTAGQA